ncbi:hypothetical protein [Antarctobacter jejuensis]|uniref:hypothetical protein n=1 Tax=Antarctobacter jejuensis TaxID=1439938 RepID=UPI003FD643C6
MRWLIIAACLLATPALSLSCLPADPVRDFKAAEKSPLRWGVAVGRLDFSEGKLPKVDWDQQQNVPPQTDLRAQMVGYALDANGFKTPFQANVTLRVLCAGPWCAQPKSGARYLAFIKHENGKRILQADPCGSWLYVNPTRRMLNRIHTCYAGGPCEERPFRP